MRKACALMLIAWGVAACGDAATPTDDVSLQEQAIRNGTRDPTLVELSEGQKLSVVWLHPTNDPHDDFCSGVLITPRHALTAAHCTYGWPSDRLSIGVGQDAKMPVAHLKLSRIREHPSADLALLELERPATEVVPQIVPIPINTTPFGEHDEGSEVEAAGYGYTYDDKRTGRWFAVLELEAVSSYELVVNGNGLRGLCFGDSGGPLMRNNAHGEAVLIGIESMGEDSCLGRDFLVRVDSFTDWLSNSIGLLPMPDPDENGQIACQRLDYQGVCDDSMLIRCDNGRLLQENCTDTDQTCGFIAPDTGFGCTDSPIELPSPGCERGEDFCDGHSRINCEEGRFVRHNCLADGLHCGLTASGVAQCQVPPPTMTPRATPLPNASVIPSARPAPRSGCAAAPGSPDGTSPGWLLVVAALLLARRRRA